MDVEKRPDDTLITVASMYVDGTMKNARTFASLARDAQTIYDLVYHPEYKEITKENREKQNISLEAILNSCLRAINEAPDTMQVASSKKKSTLKELKLMLARKRRG